MLLLLSEEEELRPSTGVVFLLSLLFLIKIGKGCGSLWGTFYGTAARLSGGVLCFDDTREMLGSSPSMPVALGRRAGQWLCCALVPPLKPQLWTGLTTVQNKSPGFARCPVVKRFSTSLRTDFRIPDTHVKARQAWWPALEGRDGKSMELAS